jgi:uncharacterized membrane protein YfcA
MSLTHVLILLATGAGAGFAGGMLGLGGGFIMSPVQYWIFTGLGLSSEVAIRTSFGTSLFVILPLSASAVWRHQRKGAVRWRAAFVMGLTGLLSSYGGATLATHVAADPLRIAFSIVLMLSGIRMLFVRYRDTWEEPVDNTLVYALCALPVGFLVGALGIGGGIVAVPVMLLALKFRMHQAVATSLATIILNSTGGIIGYIINGTGVEGRLAYSVGYINILAWLPLLLGSFFMAQVGAVTAHRLPAGQLRYIFVFVLFYFGLRMLGVFEWLGLPI